MKTDNELIAEFMGYAFQKDKTTYPSGWYICDAYADDHSKPFGYCMYPHEFKFHTSWDWLMPVVEKISLIIYESYTDNNGYKDVIVHDRAYMRTFGMIDNNGKWMVRINRMPLEQEDTLIMAVYKAVVEFIKWYEGERIGGKNQVEQSGSE